MQQALVATAASLQPPSGCRLGAPSRTSQRRTPLDEQPGRQPGRSSRNAGTVSRQGAGLNAERLDNKLESQGATMIASTIDRAKLPGRDGVSTPAGVDAPAPAGVDAPAPTGALRRARVRPQALAATRLTRTTTVSAAKPSFRRSDGFQHIAGFQNIATSYDCTSVVLDWPPGRGCTKLVALIKANKSRFHKIVANSDNLFHALC
jgi:hypothetical protein